MFTMEHYPIFKIMEGVVFYDIMDDHGRHNVKWNNPDTKRPVLHLLRVDSKKSMFCFALPENRWGGGWEDTKKKRYKT